MREQADVHGEFGVLFGGQIQERDHIPLETDRSKQTLGFQLTFARPRDTPRTVEWRIDAPGARVPDHRGRLGQGRVVRVATAQTRAGAQQFEQVVNLGEAPPPGTWNVRVLVDGRIVIDRPFLLSAQAR